MYSDPLLCHNKYRKSVRAKIKCWTRRKKNEALCIKSLIRKNVKINFRWIFLFWIQTFPSLRKKTCAYKKERKKSEKSLLSNRNMKIISCSTFSFHTTRDFSFRPYYFPSQNLGSFLEIRVVATDSLGHFGIFSVLLWLFLRGFLTLGLFFVSHIFLVVDPGGFGFFLVLFYLFLL